jgi:hypothetical protein
MDLEVLKALKIFSWCQGAQNSNEAKEAAFELHTVKHTRWN